VPLWQLPLWRVWFSVALEHISQVPLTVCLVLLVQTVVGVHPPTSVLPELQADQAHKRALPAPGNGIPIHVHVHRSHRVQRASPLHLVDGVPIIINVLSDQHVVRLPVVVQDGDGVLVT